MKNMTGHTKVIPYQSKFDFCFKVFKTADWLLWAAAALSIYFIWDPFAQTLPWLSRLLMVIDIVLILGQFVAQGAAEILLFPEAELQRLKGNFDDGTGTRLLPGRTANYYSNSEIPQGTYRLTVNFFENSFFTYNIAKKMTPKLVMKNLLFLAVFIVSALIGRNTAFALALVQLLISSQFLWTLCQHLYFVYSVRAAFEGFMSIFSEHPQHFSEIALYHMAHYERALASYKNLLDSKIFNQLNPELTKQWTEIKKRYSINENVPTSW